MEKIPESSPWQNVPHPRAFPMLRGSKQTDVAIVGGGFTGIIAAYRLAEAGISVTLLEKNRIGSGASGLTTAFLMETVDTDVKDLISQRGREKAAKIIASHRKAVDFFEDAIAKHKIECEFIRCPAYIYAGDESERHRLKEEAKAMRDIGLSASFIERDGFPFGKNGFIAVNRQAKLHPLKFLFCLAEAAMETGNLSIFEKSEVTDIQKPVSGGYATLTAKDGILRARHVLLATHYPRPRQPKSLFFKKAAYVTYVLEARLPHGALPEALYEDTENPYHYARVDRRKDHYRLIIGGEDHRADISADAEKNWEALESYMKKILGTIPYSVVRRWRGPIIESGDGLALFGPANDSKNGDAVFHATGHSGNGLTYAAIAAELFHDYVAGKENELSKIYAAARPFRARTYLPSALEYLGRFFGGAVKNAFSGKKKGGSKMEPPRAGKAPLTAGPGV